jgi:hypothetical protein
MASRRSRESALDLRDNTNGTVCVQVLSPAYRNVDEDDHIQPPPALGDLSLLPSSQTTYQNLPF